MAYDVDLFEIISLTQPVADAFVEGSAVTTIVPENAQAWEVTMVELEFDPAQLKLLSADADISMAISRDSAGGVGTIGNPRIVNTFSLFNSLTTSGQIFGSGRYRWEMPPGTLFVENEIFVQLDSTGTGQALTCQVRLHYKWVKVTEIEILRFLQNQ